MSRKWPQPFLGFPLSRSKTALRKSPLPLGKGVGGWGVEIEKRKESCTTHILAMLLVGQKDFFHFVIRMKKFFLLPTRLRCKMLVVRGVRIKTFLISNPLCSLFFSSLKGEFENPSVLISGLKAKRGFCLKTRWLLNIALLSAKKFFQQPFLMCCLKHCRREIKRVLFGSLEIFAFDFFESKNFKSAKFPFKKNISCR